MYINKYKDRENSYAETKLPVTPCMCINQTIRWQQNDSVSFHQ